MDNMDTIRSSINHHIKIGVLQGHFATNHSHVSHYIDMTTIKTKCNVAKDVAEELSAKYSDTDIDTIICLEGTQMVGAFLAERISAHGSGMNAGKNISVITPELNSNNQMIFRDNIQRAVRDRKIMLLISLQHLQVRPSTVLWSAWHIMVVNLLEYVLYSLQLVSIMVFL